MYDFRNKLETQAITHDDKARRVLNISNRQPDIDLDTIKKGVTIEQLDQCGVPILQYSTQITIHGVFNIPDLIAQTLPSGLTYNQNKSLGVRYDFIDYNKKLLLSDIARFGNGGLVTNLSSQDFLIYKLFLIHGTGVDKNEVYQQAIEFYKQVGKYDSLYIGQRYLAEFIWDMGYAVVIDLGAIYEKNLWEFANQIFGITEEEYRIQKQAKESELAARLENYRIEAEARRKKNAEIKEANTALLGENYTPAKNIDKNGGWYVKAREDGFTIYYIKGNKRKLMYTKLVKSLDEIKPFSTSSLRGGRVVDDKLAKIILRNLYNLTDDKEDVGVSIDGIKLSYERDWSWIEFNSIPHENARDYMTKNGARFSRKRKAWYFTRQINRETLEKIASLT